MILYRGKPERLPRSLIEFRADEVHASVNQAHHGVSSRGGGRLKLSNLKKPLMGTCPARSNWLRCPMSEVIADLVSGDGSQPTAERVRRAHIAKSCDTTEHGPKDLLHDIGAIFRL
jgi:hypothetical protein